MLLLCLSDISNDIWHCKPAAGFTVNALFHIQLSPLAFNNNKCLTCRLYVWSWKRKLTAVWFQYDQVIKWWLKWSTDTRCQKYTRLTWSQLIKSFVTLWHNSDGSVFKEHLCFPTAWTHPRCYKVFCTRALCCAWTSCPVCDFHAVTLDH